MLMFNFFFLSDKISACCSHKHLKVCLYSRTPESLCFSEVAKRKLMIHNLTKKEEERFKLQWVLQT